uniref:NADH dehydrogenase subunit 6 n=1 Tax=Podonevadne trigona TaxID=141406 RepID=UPI002E75F5B5|nr:NADH dehydrogenase subunit 6 [Podonevadne trigona]WPT28352.1 NADH dehydrogenase subunit 6 [Podonevadne trigona]
MLIQICYMSLTTLVASFPFLTHPLAMGITLLMLTLWLALMLGLVYTSYWLSYCLVLILLGGLLVIFIYVSLLASNKTFQLSPSAVITMLIVAIVSWSSYLFVEGTTGKMTTETPLEFAEGVKTLTMYEAFTPLYSAELNSLTIFIVLYLLLTLLVVVFNTKSMTSTLRSQKN